MNATDSHRFCLRPFRDADIALMEGWLEKPHVAAWYKHPGHWLRELRERHGEFSFLHHFIAELDGRPVGFCQYYDCYFAQAHEVWNEEWQVGTKQGEIYSIDYLIGETDCLGLGYGKRMIAQLVEKVRQTGAKKIIVEPESGNLASGRALAANGFVKVDGDYVLVLVHDCGPDGTDAGEAGR